MDWLKENSAVLISAIIGVIGALLGVIITLKAEAKRRRKEAIDKAKPVIINYAHNHITDKHKVLKLVFESDATDTDQIVGVFKNTDNGILFFDYVETESKNYYPTNCSAVDKNTEFFLVLYRIKGESLKICNIYLHDIFGNCYKYKAHFNFESNRESEIIIDSNQPVPIGKRNTVCNR